MKIPLEYTGTYEEITTYSSDSEDGLESRYLYSVNERAGKHREHR